MNRNPEKDNSTLPFDKITINTGSSKYSFSRSWTENEGLNGILVGLIADDLNRQRKNDSNSNGVV